MSFDLSALSAPSKSEAPVRTSSGGRRKQDNPLIPFVQQSWDARDKSKDGGADANYGEWLGWTIPATPEFDGPAEKDPNARELLNKLRYAGNDLNIGVATDVQRGTQRNKPVLKVSFAAKTRKVKRAKDTQTDAPTTAPTAE